MNRKERRSRVDRRVLPRQLRVQAGWCCGVPLNIYKNCGVTPSPETPDAARFPSEWLWPRCLTRGRRLKHYKSHRSKPEVEPQSKEPIYARLLRTARVATEEAATLADALLLCLRRVCDCTQWPFAHARILAQDDALDARGPRRFGMCLFWNLTDFETKHYA